MANVALDVETGYHLEAKTARWVLSDDVDYISFTNNGPTPATSKYIAYDTLNPPNPFIAVTQDGKGNVVYDGGFPKFYNTYAPPAGIDSSPSMEFRATRVSGIPEGTNTYYYNAFSNKNVVIAAGDKLVYDMIQNSINVRCAIDATTPYPDGSPYYSLRDWNLNVDGSANVIKDQNGLRCHPGTDLGNRPVNQWYRREFDLTPCAGHTFVRWSMAYEGEIPGDYYVRFRRVYVVDKDNNIKATLFKDKIDIPGSTSTEVGASGYTNLSKAVYDPRGQLSASFKYLYNALHWVANPAKVWADNRKVLILGDALITHAYPIKGTDPGGFNTSLTRLCAAAGFTPTFKDPSDYPSGRLDATLAELEAYACVLVMSSNSALVDSITDSCVADLVTYRQNGNGIILITDHGPNFTDISQVKVSAGAFFNTANRIATNFGAYFTGNVDRVPVNLGFIRANYGDHPLYAGMTDSEDISAGASESIVVAASFPKYVQATAPPVTLTEGTYNVRALAMLKNGQFETYNFLYVIATGELLRMKSDTGLPIETLDIGFKNTAKVNLEMNLAGLGTIEGEILRNEQRIGRFFYDNVQGNRIEWVTGDGTAVKVTNGDAIIARVTSPFSYTKRLIIKRNQPNLSRSLSTAGVVKRLREDGLPNAAPVLAIRDAVGKINEGSATLLIRYSTAHPANINSLKRHFSDE